jgi:hypothetical protein
LALFKDLPIGSSFGKWVITKEVEPKKHKSGKTKRMVELTCVCGGTKIAAFGDVRGYSDSSSCKDCGGIETHCDLTGMVTGKLTVTGNKVRKSDTQRRIVWECLCDCGNVTFLSKKQIERKSVLNCRVCSSSRGLVSIGDTRTNSNGFVITLLEFISPTCFLVSGAGCDKPFVVNSTTFKRCTFVSPYKVTVGGVGYYGEGNFISKVGETHTPEYRDWSCMIKRCYVQTKNYKSYEDVFVTKDWHNFQNFASWCTTQRNFNKDNWRLDKDLLGSLQGKRIYSPETCVYLPVEINSFIKTKRMNDLPIGVDTVENVSGTKYRAQSRENGYNVGLGVYDTIEEAFLSYKEHKEGLAKQLANKYKDDLTEESYTALYNYTVLDTF